MYTTAGATDPPQPKTTESTTKPAANSAQHSTSKSSSSTHKKKHAKSKASSKKRGQKAIDNERAREIQEALIRERYLQGEPSGKWDAATQAAMQRYQADQGWQSKTVPDSRALIKLGLGPSPEHLLNPETAMTSAPTANGKGEGKPNAGDPQPGSPNSAKPATPPPAKPAPATPPAQPVHTPDLTPPQR